MGTVGHYGNGKTLWEYKGIMGMLGHYENEMAFREW